MKWLVAAIWPFIVLSVSYYFLGNNILYCCIITFVGEVIILLPRSIIVKTRRILLLLINGLGIIAKGIKKLKTIDYQKFYYPVLVVIIIAIIILNGYTIKKIGEQNKKIDELDRMLRIVGFSNSNQIDELESDIESFKDEVMGTLESIEFSIDTIQRYPY